MVLFAIMSERFRERAEFEPAEAIATALRDWLQAEIISSMEGRNHILDDWEQWQKDLRLPFEDPANQNAGKAISHVNRLRNWTYAAEQYPDIVQEDYYLARQIFCAQMNISGAYRRQCFFQAADAADYRRRRQQLGPVSIDLVGAIQERINEYSSDLLASNFAYKNTAWGKLQERTLTVNEEALNAAKLVHEMGIQSMGKEDSTAVRVLRAEQHEWVKLATDYIMFAAHRPNKGWADVPFLEPKSITLKPGVYYPFSS